MFTVLHLPGAVRAFIPALLGRSALAMAGLGLILAVHSSTGSFVFAGIASAAFGLANVIAAPWRARAVDRWGQRRSLLVLGSVQALGFAGLAFAAILSAPFTVWIGLAVIIGLFAPPLGAAMRVIWADLTIAGDQRKKAFSVDAVAEELLFVIGPVLIAAIIATTSASVGMLVTGAVVLLGTIGLITSAASARQHGRQRRVEVGRRPLRQPGFVRVLCVLAGVGCVLGVVEIVAPAVAEDHSISAASGWLLAAFAAGSALGGVLYGQLRWAASLGTKMLLLCVGMGLVAVAASQARPPMLFALALLVLGLFLAPSLITGYLVADAMVSEDSRTESSAWINTAVNMGAACASGVAGLIIDGTSAPLPLLVVGILAVAVAVVVPRRHLNHRDP